MNRLWPRQCLALLFLIVSSTASHGQCSPDDTDYVVTTVADRITVDDVFLGTSVTPEGGDASYASTTVAETDTLQNVTTITTVDNQSDLAVNGGTAETGIAIPIAAHGYGGYTNNSQITGRCL